MPRFSSAGALAVLCFAAASPAIAADPTGLWAAPANGGRVEISRCGAALCGVLTSSDDIRRDPGFKDINNRDRALCDRPLKGLTMLSGFTGGPARWTGGRVYNPEDGQTYSGSIELRPDGTLKLKGCIVAPLCRSQVWTRAR